MMDPDKKKNIIENVLCGLGIVAIYVLLFLLLLYGTSAECWYAGEHTEGCNGADNCGCYEKLLEMDRQKSEQLKGN